ncbi:MAG: hypothetical protein KC910_14445 [Candidatus Eremiobacteraeota bacterium]|nr:hypothetical protein [Candidatus Eremiobacteraeota bacterium]
MSWTESANWGLQSTGQNAERWLAHAHGQAGSHSQKAVISNLMAMVSARDGNYQSAQEYWDEARQLWSQTSQPEQAAALAELNGVLTANGLAPARELLDPFNNWQQQTALEATETAATDDGSSDWQMAMREAIEELAANRGQRAAFSLSSAAKHGGGRGALALNTIALACFMIGDYAGAAEAFGESEASWRQTPPDSASLQFLADQLLARGWERSAQALHSGAPIDPWSAWSRDLGMQMEGQTGAGPAGPTSWDEAMELGLVRIREGDGESALRAMAAAEFLTQDPSRRCLALDGIAWAATLVGDYTQAQDAWGELCQLSSGFQPDVGKVFLEMLSRSGLHREADLVRSRLADNQAPLVDPWRDFAV